MTQSKWSSCGARANVFGGGEDEVPSVNRPLCCNAFATLYTRVLGKLIFLLHFQLQN